MLTAQTKKGAVYAWEVQKTDGPFWCSECEGEVILKLGYINIEHFAHRVAGSCTAGAGESAAHLQAKRDIFCALQTHPQVTRLQLERSLKEVRPDVSFLLANRYRIAIEVQLSALSPGDIARRTEAYMAKGIYVLWMPPFSENLEEEHYAPRVWERYLQALYYGRTYYWQAGETVQPVKFEVYENEPRQYYSGARAGQWYISPSQRYRTPCFLPAASITRMQPIIRAAYHSKEFELPAAWLWGVRSKR